MKKFLFIFSIILVCLSCYEAPPMTGLEFTGTWVRTVGIDVITITLTDTAFSMSMTGSATGTRVMSIDSYDIGTNRLHTTVTSGSGDLDLSVGTVLLYTYVISGDNLYYDDDEGSGTYPTEAEATFGPFLKQ